MTGSGPDPRRRRAAATSDTESGTGAGRAPGTKVANRNSFNSGFTGRPLGRSALWSGEDDSRHHDGPQPLRASWTPVPEDTRPHPATDRSRRRTVGTDADDRAGYDEQVGSHHDQRPTLPSAAPKTPATNRRVRRRTGVGWFVHRYGWRAWALPVLVALTVVVIVQAVRAPDRETAAGVGPAAAGNAAQTVTLGMTTTVVTTAPPAEISASQPAAIGATDTAPAPSLETNTTLSTGPNPNGKFADQVKSGALPPGGTFVAKGKGTWHVVKGTGKPVGHGPEKFTYTVEVEDGVQSAAADKEFAEAVDAALADKRSWIAGGQFILQRVDSGTPSFRISLTSQMTIRSPSLCGYGTPLEASCYNRIVGRVMINNARWARGAVSFNGDLGLYRVYAINHEVGHALGYGHQFCTEDGGLAPVMMQQSFSTSNDELHLLDPEAVAADHKVCRFNAFPYPRGSAG